MIYHLACNDKPVLFPGMTFESIDDKNARGVIQNGFLLREYPDLK